MIILWPPHNDGESKKIAVILGFPPREFPTMALRPAKSNATTMKDTHAAVEAVL